MFSNVRLRTEWAEGRSALAAAFLLTLDGALTIADVGDPTTNSYTLFTVGGVLTNSRISIGAMSGLLTSRSVTWTLAS